MRLDEGPREGVRFKVRRVAQGRARARDVGRRFRRAEEEVAALLRRWHKAEEKEATAERHTA